MSEERAPYRVSYTSGKAVRGALRRETRRLASMDGRYVGPEPELIRALIELQGWSQVDVANTLRVDVSTVRRWCTDRARQQFKEIPFAAWWLLLLRAGAVSVDALEKSSRRAC